MVCTSYITSGVKCDALLEVVPSLNSGACT